MASTQLFSQQTGHKYTFQLQLKKLCISPSLPFQVKIVWARGQNRIQSQNPIKLITLQQCFCNKSTVLFSPTRQQFRKKQSRIQIILYANGSPKQGGQFVLNLCQILDPLNIKQQQQKTYRVVTRQEKPRCQIQFKLTAEYCQEMVRDQQRSIGSGVGSISSKNTTSMAHGSSTMQGFDAKQYVQKKNLFLYQAPSKDNQSVVSYNSYSTNMMRYPSGAKKQRQDSVRKQQYGLGTTTRRQVSTNDMFSKTTSVNMKSIGGDFDNKSRGGYNRVTQLQTQYDNRTQNFDNPSNKQLQQQQAKRSKLQAQVSRLSIYMKEQSSKLTQYIQENTRLKEQLKRLSLEQQSVKPSIQKQSQVMKQQYQLQMGKVRQESDDMRNRAFQLNNQNRQLHRRLDVLLEEREKTDEEVRRVRMEKERAEARFQSLNRNMEGIISTKEMSSKEVENLRDQLEHIKSLNANLRDNLQKQRRKTQQLQYSTTYQQSSLQENFKKKQQRLYQLQRQNTQLVTQTKDREKQLQTKKDLLYRLQRTSNQYKEKILVSESQKSKFLLENASLKNQAQRLKLQLNQLKEGMTRVKDEKTTQYEQRNSQLQTLNYQTQQRVRALQYQVDQQKKSYSQLISLNDTIKRQLEDKKTEIYRLQSNFKSLKQVENKFYSLDKSHTDKQRQLLLYKGQNNKLLTQRQLLQQQFQKLTQQLQQAKLKALNVPNVDVNQILRQSVQMQVQLKFKTDELLRLKGIDERFNQLVYRLETEERNRQQVQAETQRLQKQVKDKNKLYLIEVEKGKLILKDKSQLQKVIDQLKNQLKRCQEIIFNGDRQVKDMQQHIVTVENLNLQIKSKLSTLQNQLTYNKSKLLENQKQEARVRELELQCSDKLSTLNLMTNNLANAQKRIYQLQYTAKSKELELEQTTKTAQSSSQKLIQMEAAKSIISSQLHRLLTERKSIQLKSQTMMRQLHSLKKQYQEEKVKSTSVGSIRSTEDQTRIRHMQNQLQKKDKMISKLTKEKLQIEEENINLHVQVMKKLSEMEKNKDSTQSTDSAITQK